MAGKNNIIVNGETYYTASGAAGYLDIKRGLFYANIRKRIQPYQLGSCRRTLYKQSDLEQFKDIKPIAS